MQLAFETGSLATAGFSVEDYLKVASNLGFKYVEFWIDRGNLWPYTAGEKEKNRVRELLSSFGLEVVSTCPIPFSAERWEKFEFEFNLAHPVKEERKKAIEFIKDSVNLTRELGGCVMITLPGKVEQPSFMESQTSYRRYFEQAVESLKECAQLARDAGVTLGVENAVVGNFIDLPEEMLRLLEAVGSEYVKAYLDVANANVYHPPLEYIHALRGWLANCMHITDNDGSHAHHLPIGMGTIDFKTILKELKATGWDGYLIP
ncbi:MAG: sugar phosphate isomerase/epimerase family protein, partial [Thermoproteota archaeon]